ncbi:MAG: sulfatase-like hydrolase/transferase, partial [Planctomycetota bacterium]
IDNYSHFFFWSGPNRQDLFENRREFYRPGEYFPDLMVEKCKEFIDAGKNDDKPWLLYWAFNAPHYPYQGTPSWLERYSGLSTPRREYNAFVSTMDEKIGEVLAALEQSGQSDNTIVIYQPDHGHSTETRAFGGGGNAGPYRGAKFSLFEGGIRVVSLVRYPEHLEPGGVHNGFATGCDWLPTLCEWAEVPVPNTHLDGVSIVHDLTELKPYRKPEFYWQFGSGPKPQWAVRQGPWKLIGNPFDTTRAQSVRGADARQIGEVFLANLESDLGERENLKDKNPEVVASLSELRDQWMISMP